MIGLDEAGRGLAWTRITPPAAALQPWVEHCWITYRPPDEPAGRSWKIVPDLSPNLLIHEVGSDRRLRVVGARSKGIEVDVRKRSWTVGVRLAPGTLPALTGLPADELTDTGAGPCALWGPEGEGLARQVQDSRGPQEALRIVVRFLAGRFVTAEPVDWKVRAALAGGDTVPPPDVASVASRSGLSRRCLQRNARDRIGLAPKTILRIRRLFRTLSAALATPSPDWSRLAAQGGFYDGAHLAREFRLLLGEPPTAWRARADSPGP